MYNAEKESIRIKSTGHVGSGSFFIYVEVRVSFLAYQVQRIQRNKYIAFMVIYVTIVLNVYLRLLYHIYEKRGDYETKPLTKADDKDRQSLNRTSSGSEGRLSSKPV